MKRVISKIKKNILSILLMTILLIYIVAFTTGMLFKVKTFVVTSDSMLPEFGVGDVLLAYRQEHYSPDDVISFEVEDAVVTHRIKKIIKKDTNILFETKGDANKQTDAVLIRNEKVLGKIIFSISKIGYVILFLQSKMVSIFLILTTILYLLYLSYLAVK